MMNANSLEQKLKNKVTDLGGEVYSKSISPAVIEYLVILPGGCTGFVFIGTAEKLPTGTLKKIQHLRTLGCAACGVKEEKHVEDAMCYILSRAYRDPDWYRFKAENGRKGELNGI